MLPAEGVREFFIYARRRHEVYLRRQAGDPPPWTNDPVLQQYRFTNIFRELDRTTIWCREHVRERYEGRPEVLPAIVVFRWFNKIETGEAMFDDPLVPGGPRTAFDHWLQFGSDMKNPTNVLRDAIILRRGDGPYVNGAYIIKSPPGMSKLDGVLQCCEKFRTEKMSWTSAPQHRYMSGFGWQDAVKMMTSGEWGLELTWDWLRQFDQQGDFTAYEVVTDLRHTYLLRNAPDIVTWANAGPGAVRGLNRLSGRPFTQSLPKHQSLAEMQELLHLSTRQVYWPRDWGSWEMREVEHTLCEFDKWMRARVGDGTPKQRYAGSGT